MIARVAFVLALIAELGGFAVADPPSGTPDAAASARPTDAGVAPPAAVKHPLFVSVSAIPNESLTPTVKPSRWWIGVVVAGAIGAVFAITVTAATLGGGGGGGGDPYFHGNVAPGLQRIP